jgi:hypothetical protein
MKRFALDGEMLCRHEVHRADYPAAAVSILLFAEATQPGGLFLKKRPPSMLSKRKHVD